MPSASVIEVAKAAPAPEPIVFAPPKTLRVAVTGATGYIGSRLVTALAERGDVERVVAIDVKPLTGLLPPKVHVVVQDVTRPLDQLFVEEGVQQVMHLAFVLNSSRNRNTARMVNVGGTSSVLRACALAGVQHIVYLSSTSVYGAHPDNPQAITEEQPARPVPGFAYSEDKVAAEKLLIDYAKVSPKTCVTILRSSVVMGPHARNFIADALMRPRMVGVTGADPPMQFFHEDDLVALLEHVLRQPKPGTFNIGSQDTVRYSEMVGMSGRKVTWLPAWLLYPLINAMWVLRLQNDSPACGVDFIRWPWVASTEKLRQEYRFMLKHTSRETVEAFLREQLVKR